MNKLMTFFIVLFLLTITVTAQIAIPNVVSGKIERIERFPSKYVTSRNIDIWLPDGYSESKKYAVLYMNDGQMLFDPKTT